MKILYTSVLYTSVLVLLASCASTEGDVITYTQDGTEMIATLSDGTAIRAPCIISTSRAVTRIGKAVEYCELAQEHRQYILERQREVTELAKQGAAASAGTQPSQ